MKHSVEHHLAITLKELAKLLGLPDRAFDLWVIDRESSGIVLKWKVEGEDIGKEVRP